MEENNEKNSIEVPDVNDEESFEENDKKEKKISPKKLIMIIITALLVISCIVCIVVIIIKDKKDNKRNEQVADKIVRPADNLEYSILKQSYFNMSCKKTNTGIKYKKLTKGLIIECEFGFGLNQKVSELYFDLGNSANVKLNSVKNDTEAKLINNDKTYKLTFKNPESVLASGIRFYYEVLNDTDETGYVEVEDIVFKDDTDKYYKVVNSIETFPPEYDDKLYIYKDTYDEEDGKVYYYSSKVKYTDQELFDTFQCQNESCETKTESNNYFLIHDQKLLLYDTLKKTSITLNIPDDLKIDDYTYELMVNSKGKIYGVAFKKDYVTAYDCNINEYVCINTGLSGYEMGYYSLALNNFSIALDYGFVGTSAYNGYDVALMLKKDDKIGVFSYEDDNMMVELNEKYKTIDYDDQTGCIMLEIYDQKNDNYYFEYFNPVYSLFTVDTDNLQKYDNSNIYYTTAYNKLGTRVTMLFDNKGKQLKNLPYVISDNLISVTDKIIVKDEVFTIYDLKGNKLYSTKYDPKDILAYTESYIVTINDNKIVLLDTNGKELSTIKELSDGVKFVSAEENENGVLIVIIKDASIKEEGKNAYKYTIEINKPFQTETIFVE